MAISEALIAVLSFLEEQHPFVPALIQHFPSSPIFSLSYAMDFQLAALEQNGHNCHGYCAVFCFVFFFFNLLSSFSGAICGGAVSASAPEQLRVPVSRAVFGEMFGRVLYPARLPRQLGTTSNSSGASWCLTLQTLHAAGLPWMQLQLSGCLSGKLNFHSWTQYRDKN